MPVKTGKNHSARFKNEGCRFRVLHMIYSTRNFRLEKVQFLILAEINSRSIASAIDPDETIFSLYTEVFSLFFMQQNRAEVPI
jgi:hypothetical protein